MRLPLVQFILNASLDARQATEGREEGFVARQNIEVELDVACRIDRDGAVLEVVQAMGPRGWGVSGLERARGRGSRVTYTAWL
jgi:hypothetical protein